MTRTTNKKERSTVSMQRRKIMFDVDFSLSLENRTGKYFMCRDVLSDIQELIHTTRYWRFTRGYTPRSPGARLMWRLLLEEAGLRSSFPLFDRWCPRLKSKLPIFFTDPLETIYYRLKPSDIVLCHDMGPITNPELYSGRVPAIYKKAFDYISSARPQIIFVSQSSRTEFERLYGAAYNGARVVYPGMRFDVTAGDASPIEGIKPPFLLTVGTVGWRKNQARCIQAFQLSGLHEAGFTYVICGGPDFGYQEVADLAAKCKNVTLTGYTNDRQLRWLYQSASGFVLPSLLEGFGIPGAEAVLRGLVPLVGSKGALQEVVGDSAILVDPLSIESIASGMLNLVQLPESERQQRLLELKNHTAKFSRESATKAWRLAFDDLLGTNS